MIYQQLIVTDQSSEESCHDKNFVPCHIRLNCHAQGDAEKINLSEKVGK